MPDQLLTLVKEVGALDANYKALHRRTDDIEKNVKEQLDKIVVILNELVAKENRRTGWIAAMVFIGSLISGIISYLLKGKI